MSTANLTLEEFTSSTTPLPTILVPRPHALHLVELCESAEMAPSNNFLSFITGDNTVAAVNNSKGDNQHPHVLVTQMALLLYLGEYTHARHLWRRHRRIGVVSPSSSSASNDNGNAAVNSSKDRDYAQLELLWNAAKYCYLWSTGGIHSLTSSGSITGLSSSTAATSSSSEDNTNGMQVENESSTDDTADLPFSTLALRALQSCSAQADSSTQKKMEPLATYSSELIGVFRSRVNRGLHASFDKLDCTEYCLRMNLDATHVENGSGDGVWNEYGWKREGKYLVSDVDVVLDEDEAMGGMAEGTTGGEKEKRIEKLTDIVMFLEGKMNA